MVVQEWPEVGLGLCRSIYKPAHCRKASVPEPDGLRTSCPTVTVRRRDGLEANDRCRLFEAAPHVDGFNGGDGPG